MNKLELLIAWRYLGAQRKSLFVSLIGIFSMLGVSIGVFALVVALAAACGGQRFRRRGHGPDDWEGRSL